MVSSVVSYGWSLLLIILTDSGSGGDSDAPNICEETKPPKDLTNIVISEYE